MRFPRIFAAAMLLLPLATSGCSCGASMVPQVFGHDAAGGGGAGIDGGTSTSTATGSGSLDGGTSTSTATDAGLPGLDGGAGTSTTSDGALPVPDAGTSTGAADGGATGGADGAAQADGGGTGGSDGGTLADGGAPVDAGPGDGGGILGITTAALPAGSVGAAYAQLVGASGGAPPYSFALGAGVLPPGLSLSPSGQLSGVPGSPGRFTFTLVVSDAASGRASATFTLVVQPPVGGSLTVTTARLPNGVVGAPYAAALAATGGAAPYTWTVASGALPPGLGLGADGTIGGTPTTPGGSSFVVRVRDAGQPSLVATATLAITVLGNAGGLQITTAALPGGTVGHPYTAALSASGGLAPYSWSVSSGMLPPGLALTSAGVLSGTPALAGSFSVTVQVSDGSTPLERAAQPFTVVIVPPPLQVTNPGLPSGIAGERYSAAVQVTGGVAPYAFAVTAGALPAGLALDPLAGTIQGIPASAGQASFTVQVADSARPQDLTSQAYTLAIAPATTPLAVTTSRLPQAIAGVAYTASVTAAGGTAPYSFAVVGGSLPDGVTLGASGAVAGTPARAGAFGITVQVTDASARQATGTVALTVVPPLLLAGGALPQGQVNAAFAASVSASGGVPPYAYAVRAGALPPGVDLSPDGTLSGAPTSAGVFGFTVGVGDASSPAQSATQNFAITVVAPLAITSATLPDGTIGSAYRAPLLATGGTPPYAWAISAGALPTGLALDRGTGILSGTPSQAGMFSFTVAATDASSPAARATRPLEITVHVPTALAIDTGALPGGIVGRQYSGVLAATGGTAPYTWSISAGALPAGLSVDPASGLISGTPSSPGTVTFTVEVADAEAPTAVATRQLSIIVSNPLVVSTAVLAEGVTGVAYAAKLVATGGASPYGWSISAGALPPGLSLDSSGAIHGTPSAAGSFAFTAAVTDSGSPQQGASAVLTITINAALTLGTSNLPVGTVGSPYTAILSASGGQLPYSWTVTAGALPAGLTLDAARGVISGRPTTAQHASFTIGVSDAAAPNQTASRAFTVIINGAGTLTISTAALGGGAVGVAYAASLGATGGTTPYTWALSAGSLPPGLTLGAATGAIGGTPTAAGTFSVTVLATDASVPPQMATRQLAITVAPPLVITTASLPGGVTGAAYGAPLSATGGTSPYTWSLRGGALPAGLALNPATGVISGTPVAAAGTSSFQVQVADSGTPLQTATASLQIVVTAALTIGTSQLANAIVNRPYQVALAASGGTPPYAWTLAAGALPAGMTLSPAGVLSGVATTAGSSSFTVQVTDASAPSQSVTRNLTLLVTPSLVIVTTSLPKATEGDAYAVQLFAQNGNRPYFWSQISGTMPAGLFLGANGVIQGTPTQAGSFSFTVEVADASTPSDTAAAMFTLEVSAVGTLSITTASLPGAVTGTAYLATVAANGGTTPYTFTLARGTLPPGLTISSGGTISGTPSQTGTFSFTVRVADASTPRQTAMRSLSIAVSAPLVISTMTLSDGVRGTPYSGNLVGSGGTLPYGWSVSAGALPPGLAVDAGTGVVSGTPTSAGTFQFTITLDDASSPQQSARRAFMITIVRPLTITTMTLPNPQLGVPYLQRIATSGGTRPFGWSVSAGTLPPGLLLDATTGTIVGLPLQAGTFTFTVRVTDSSNPLQQALAQYTVTVN